MNYNVTLSEFRIGFRGEVGGGGKRGGSIVKYKGRLRHFKSECTAMMCVLVQERIRTIASSYALLTIVR